MRSRKNPQYQKSSIKRCSRSFFLVSDRIEKESRKDAAFENKARNLVICRKKEETDANKKNRENMKLNWMQKFTKKN